ncbi:hypothetical protein M3Y97_00098200 [Aphelenchoides bicaudatus]|nr:hypothetical protein M3Y97_00098200 [Aphelenchoides bicaudatus]
MNLFILLYLMKECYASPPESRLLTDLLRGYLIDERPVVESKQPVVVKLGVILQQIIDLNERMEQLTVNMWLKFEWEDVNLKWEPKEYENISDLRYPFDRIWKPGNLDVLLYNSVDSAFDTTFKVNLVGLSNGQITFIPPTVSIDEEICFFKFGSWSFSGFQLDLVPGDFSITDYLDNGEWVLLKTWVVRDEKFYGTNNEPFQSLKFFLHLRRRTLYYTFNLFFPCTLIMVLMLLGFSLNSFSCEKVGLQISISLTITIFMTIMTGNDPTNVGICSTSGRLSFKDVWFCPFVQPHSQSMFKVFTFDVTAAFRWDQRLALKTGDIQMRYFLLELIPFILRIKNPNHQHTFNSVKNSFKEKRWSKCKALPTEKEEAEKFIEKMDTVVREVNVTDKWLAEKINETNSIYKRIRILREANDETAEEHRNSSEWQFAALVVDRLCLILFTLLFLGTVLMFIVRAPYLMSANGD